MKYYLHTKAERKNLFTYIKKQAQKSNNNIIK